jgi:hypothetical protein
MGTATVAVAGSAAIAAWLARTEGARRAALVEGLAPIPALPEDLAITPLAPGCPCCLGQLPMRVALVRLLRRHRPEHVLLVLAGDAHLDRVRDLLADPALSLEAMP